jgi:hypothetical protein
MNPEITKKTSTPNAPYWAELLKIPTGSAVENMPLKHAK